MKTNLIILTSGLFLCACVDTKYDVVTGHARVISNHYHGSVQPVVRAEPQAEVVRKETQVVVAKPVQIAPAPAPAAPTPAPVATPRSNPVSQQQPAVAHVAPKPVPAAPVEPVAPQKKTTPVAQQQPAAAAPAAPAPVVKQAPVAKPIIEKREPGQLYVVVKPQPISTTPRGTIVTQKQPAAVTPAPATRSYPVMPGQNRGLHTRDTY